MCLSGNSHAVTFLRELNTTITILLEHLRHALASLATEDISTFNMINILILTFGFCRLLVGAPYEMNGPYQTGDVYKCSLSKRTNGNGCSKLNLGIVSLNTTQLLLTVTVTILVHLHKCVYTCYTGIYRSACLSACVSVSFIVACARQKCGYHSSHSAFYSFFKWSSPVPTCELYHTSCTLLHTWHTCCAG